MRSTAKKFNNTDIKSLFKNDLPTLGIISGAGPEAGAVMYKRVANHLQHKAGAWRDAHFPFIHTVNFPFEEMLQEPIDHALVGRQIAAAIAYMVDDLGCDYVVIACNTLHHFLPSDLPPQFLNMVQLIKEKLPKGKVPLVYASATSAQENLHGKLLGCEVEYFPPKISQQWIDAILAGKKVDLTTLEESSFKRPVILGCTEYSAALDGSSAPFIDPLSLVAEAYYALIDIKLREHCEKIEADIAARPVKITLKKAESETDDHVQVFARAKL